ncbi:MAG: ribosomal protein S18-alanine N-acetyltransferase [Chloroflexi bacterium]|nr:ribosomal protein S18-alanine N-acetyltransferase [Chloroflexota bacterium]
MRTQHLDTVMEIEYAAFSAPWSANAYEYELHHNAMAHYYISVPQTPIRKSVFQSFRSRWFKHGESNGSTPVVGYGGFWLMTDEAHISTIASHPAWRKRGIGELLLVAMIEAAAELNARVATLEVRVSNHVAQMLYAKYGFAVVGERVNYYSDNGENAWIMTTPAIGSAVYQQQFQKLKTQLFDRLSR